MKEQLQPPEPLERVAAILEREPLTDYQRDLHAAYAIGRTAGHPGDVRVGARFPSRCPYCNAAPRTYGYVPTLGNQVEYWCGRCLNDNGGRAQGDWTKCRA